MITNIDVNRLCPHPNNPRKDLKDITELADSIRATGVMQNLTVVPQDMELYTRKTSSKKAYPGDYTVIIGHRRLAAAKLAGLTYVPCAVSDMDEKQQISTMLLDGVDMSQARIAAHRQMQRI